MKIIILCGGTGTRMKEETEFKPKPLVEVGGKPIIWHIMKIYAHHGFNDFILALGYKGNMIKEYFLHWQIFLNDFTLETKNNNLVFHKNDCDDFKITFAETGAESLTGERVRRAAKYLDENEDFMVSYGDGVGDIDIKKLVEFHHNQNTPVTITGVKPSTRYGLLDIDYQNKKIKGFYQHKVTDKEEKQEQFRDYINEEKQEQFRDYINGGFMVFKKQALDYIAPDSMIESIFTPLAVRGELSVFLHPGRWKCMDTYKEVEEMNENWLKDPFWKVWN